MRKRPSESPQAAGRRFERWWSKVFPGSKVTPGSGNVWWSKLDVAGGAVTFSCKWTEHESFSISKKLLRECDHAIHENGDNSIPAIAVSIDNGAEVIVVMRAADLMRILTEEQSIRISPSKSEQKRLNSRVPSLLRADGSSTQT